MSYSLNNLSKKQLLVIQEATELLLRVQLGQWNEIVKHLPLKCDIDHDKLYKTKKLIAEMLSEFMIDNIDGIFASLGIGNKNLPESTAIALDIRDSIRSKLSWEEAVSEGIAASEDEERRWPRMISVIYDKPFQWSKENLPIIEKTS